MAKAQNKINDRLVTARSIRTSAHILPFAVLLFLILPGLIAAPDTAGATGVAEQQPASVSFLENVRHWIYPEKVRVVLDFSTQELDERELGLTQKDDGLTTRLELTAKAAKTLPSSFSIQDVVLKSVTLRPVEENRTEVLIALNYRIPVKCFFLKNPCRLVIDCLKLYEEKKESEVAPGLMYEDWRLGTVKGLLHLHLLTIDLERYRLCPALANDTLRKKATVSTMTEREGALAGVNAGFFAGNGAPLGLMVLNQEWLTSSLFHRTAFLVPREGPAIIDKADFKGCLLLKEQESIPIQSLNSLEEFSEGVIVYTQRWGTTLTMPTLDPYLIVENEIVKEIHIAPAPPVPNPALPLPAAVSPSSIPLPEKGYLVRFKGHARQSVGKFNTGDKVQIRFQLTGSSGPLLHALGAGPRLVRDGRVTNTALEERFRKDVVVPRTSRSLLGLAPGKAWLVCVEGRNKLESVGMTLEEAGQWMVRIGAMDAMNLDGGSSVSMVIKNRLVTVPANGKEKQVSNALVVLPK